MFTENDKNFTEVKKPKFKKFFIAIIVASLLVIAGLVTFIAIETSKPRKKNEKTCNYAHEAYNTLISNFNLGKYEKFAVAVDNKYCSTVGKEFFEKNASVVDVAIASALCNSIMNAQSMGIGGGFFMNIYLKNQNKSYIIDAREKAPLNSYKNMFVNDNEKATLGGLASGIPGEIKGYWEAHRIGGKLPWKDLFEPAIKLCINGFEISEPLAYALNSKESLIKKNRGLSEMFINPDTNRVYKEKDIIKLPKLGKTLSYISTKGPDVFYNGFLTGLIVSEINDFGGNVTIEDFLNYKVTVHENRYVERLDDNHRIYTAPPPSSGILIPFIMKLMRGYGLENESKLSNESKNLFYQRLVESFKHAYAKRSFLGDENFLNLTKLLNDLRDESYISSIRNKIKDNQTYPSSFYGPANNNKDSGTAHISVLGPNGDAVSLTSTINNYFGSKNAGIYTGIIYNDIMDDFSTPGVANSFGFAPSEANFIEAEKKPLSSMSPIIIVDNNNNVRLILGASGGSKIISAISQVAIKCLWMGTDLKTAIDSRRIHHQLYPENIEFESGFESHVEEFLIKIGHKPKCFNFGGSIIQGIQVLEKMKFSKNILAYSDPRKGGKPDGI